jgi:hypothetical protein
MPMQQGRAEFLFELANLCAKRRLRNMQLLRRACHAAEFHDTHEILELLKRRNGSLLFNKGWLMLATAKDYIAMPCLVILCATPSRYSRPGMPPSPKQKDWATRRKCFWIQKCNPYTMDP